MSVTRVGATKQYSDNWENIFGGGRNGRPARKKKSLSAGGKSAKKKSAKTKLRKPAKAKKKAGRK